MRRLLFIAVFACIASLMGAQNSIQVQVHKVVAEDEQFNVQFIIEGENRTSDFEWSPGEDFQLIWGPQSGHSTSMQIINGTMTKSVQTSYSYVLMPLKTGKFVLPKAKAKVKGKEIYSESVTVEVVASGQSSASQGQSQTPNQGQGRQTQSASSGSELFLTLELSDRKVVVGEPITAELKLYQRADIAGLESAQFPDFNGFWSQEIEAPTNIEFTRSTYNGQIYNVALLRKYLLIPQQEGKLTIDPATLVCLVNVRTPSRGTSIFDGFFDDFTTVRKRAASKPVTVTVSPLPANAPSSFCGGVGQFNISARISKDSLKTHEAASLLVTVSGTGNISLLQIPDVKFPPDMEVYDTKVSDKVEKTGISGSRTYEYPFIPRSYGDFVIDPVKYTYYDIKSRKYITLSTDPILFNVAKGSDSDEVVTSMSGTVLQKNVRNLGTDIRYINVKDHGLSAKGYFFVGSLGFWLALILLLMLAVILWFALRKIAARRADVAGNKNRKATRMALKRLKLAETFLKQNLYSAFYEELHKALLGFISDKTNVPVGELSKDRISEILQTGNVDKSQIDNLLSLLDACEFARYSPSAGYDAMSAHYSTALEVISSIDANLKSNMRSSKKPLYAILLLMLLPFAADAKTEYVDSLWTSSNQAYSQGDWAGALDGYQKIADLSLESAALWCNMGNAWYKDGNISKAILCYERALKLDPSYQDARFNLDFANSQIQDKIESVPELIFTTWMRKCCYIMDSDSWAIVGLVFFALTLSLVLLFLLGSTAGARRAGFFTALVALLLTVASFSFSMWQKNDYIAADSAIVMRPVTSAKSSPSYETAKDLFVLHEGTKVKVVDSVGDWKNIELADGRQGWIPSVDIETI